MHPGILSISEVDSPARVLEYDYGYEKLIERGGSSVNPTLKVASTRKKGARNLIFFIRLTREDHILSTE